MRGVTIHHAGTSYPFTIGLAEMLEAQRLYGRPLPALLRELGGDNPPFTFMMELFALGLSTARRRWSADEAADVMDDIGLSAAAKAITDAIKHAAHTGLPANDK